MGEAGANPAPLRQLGKSPFAEFAASGNFGWADDPTYSDSWRSRLIRRVLRAPARCWQQVPFPWPTAPPRCSYSIIPLCPRYAGFVTKLVGGTVLIPLAPGKSLASGRLGGFFQCFW